MTARVTALATGCLPIAVLGLFLLGCGEGDVSSGPERPTVKGRAAASVGASLQNLILERAAGIAPHNRPYVFDGVQDCYGYVRQVINPFLIDGSPHPEDYYPNEGYDRKRWLTDDAGLPLADAPSHDWVGFSDASELLPGDVLATEQGHRWGDGWHGGIFAGWSEDGTAWQWDNTDNAGDGAYQRTLTSRFTHYYRPLHDLLAQTGE